MQLPRKLLAREPKDPKRAREKETLLLHQKETRDGWLHLKNTSMNATCREWVQPEVTTVSILIETVRDSEVMAARGVNSLQ